MAAYGKGQMLGSGINPESFKQDYSGFSRAAEIQAQGLSNLGQSIGGSIQSYSEMKKLQQEDERAVQKSKSVAKAIGDLIPDLQPTLEGSLKILDDKELPLSQRKAEADAISDILNLGIGEIRNRKQMELEGSQIEAATNAAKARAEAAARVAPPIEKFGTPAGELQLQWNPQTQSYERPRINLQGGNLPQATTQNQIDEALAIGLMPKNDGTEGLPPAGDFEATNMLLNGGDQIGFTPNEELEVAKPLSLEQKKQFGLPDDKQYVAKFKGNEIISIPEIIKLPEQAVKFRPATLEESKPFGGMEGQIDESTGRFYPVAESAPELKLKLLKKAAEFYSKNNKAEALQYATAAGIGGLFGNLTISDLDDYFGSGISPATSEPATPVPVTPTPVAPVAPKIKVPLKSIIPIKK
jgi:hypothetical protein